MPEIPVEVVCNELWSLQLNKLPALPASSVTEPPHCAGGVARVTTGAAFTVTTAVPVINNVSPVEVFVANTE